MDAQARKASGGVCSSLWLESWDMSRGAITQPACKTRRSQEAPSIFTADGLHICLEYLHNMDTDSGVSSRCNLPGKKAVQPGGDIGFGHPETNRYSRTVASTRRQRPSQRAERGESLPSSRTAAG